MPVAELDLTREGAVVRVIRVHRTPPLRLGRHVDNSVVLLDEDVSGYHAVISVRDEGVQVTDLRSTNGTWVNDVRVSEATLVDGDVLRLGLSCVLRFRALEEPHRAPPLLLDLTAGTVHPMIESTATIGSSPTSHIHLPDGPARAATVTLHGGRDLWLEDETGGRSLRLGEVFRVAGHELRVDRANPRAVITAAPQPVVGPTYALRVALDAPGGPIAVVRDTATGREHTVQGETRATLLFVLGRARRDELRGGSPETAGWMDDEAVLVAVWGRAALRQAASTWSVLLHRLRKELEEDGFDPSFLEKRRGATRLRLDRIELQGEGGVGEL